MTGSQNLLVCHVYLDEKHRKWKKSKLNPSQFITLRFLSYISYNDYAIHPLFDVSDIVDASSGAEDDTELP